MAQENSYKVCVAGLGSMGMGAAKSCIAAGLATYGVDVSSTARAALAAAGAAGVAEDAGKFADDIDALLLLVVNIEQVRTILFGDAGVAGAMKPGALVVVSSTIPAHEARSIGDELSKRGILYLDAPVSGGSVKAEKGEMTVMASGSDEAFDKAQPLLDAIATKVFRIGSQPGQGSAVKIVHQLLAGVHIAAAAEAMALAAKSGIPLDVMYEVVTNAAGNSWMFENRMRHVLDGDYTPRSMVDIFVKDLGLVAETGRQLKFPLPLSAIAHSMFVTASNLGHGREDDSAVIKIFAGIRLPGQE